MIITIDAVIDVVKTLDLLDSDYTMLLDSCIRISDTGDHTLLVFKPEFVITGDQAITFVHTENHHERIEMPVLRYMDEYRIALPKVKRNFQSGQVFNGGFVGYLSYDFGMELVGISHRKVSKSKIPEICFGYFENYILIDWVRGCTTICTEDIELVQRLQSEAVTVIATAAAVSKSSKTEQQQVDKMVPMKLTSNCSKEAYESSVEQVRQYIRKGEVYQVNISQQFSGAGSVDALALYKRVRAANYGPYNAYLNLGDFHVLSTSPEQLLRVRNRQITSRPIKGTNRRSLDALENARLKEELLASEKDRAELLMIVDLERNDLSKLCIPGSVKVEKLYVVEEYATVNHLVSTINGTLLEGITISDIMKAMFPGGSITGAPKLRAMEIIEELERLERGIYTGSIGYISNNGCIDFNIAIRTTIASQEGVCYNVGGGITWDSNPADEFEETLQKGKAIYKVLAGGD